MWQIIFLFFAITSFSALTVVEIIILKRAGLDIIAHLKIMHESGKSRSFFFEAFGVIAFIIAQPVLLTWLLVWASRRLDPQFYMAFTEIFKEV